MKEQGRIILGPDEYVVQASYFAGRYICEGEDGARYFLKTVGENGLIAHRDVLPRINQGGFKHLALPEYKGTGLHEEKQYIALGYEDGEDYHAKWHESIPDIAGGRAISVDTVERFLALVEDLMSVDISNFIKVGLERLTGEDVILQYNRNAQVVLGAGLVMPEQIENGRLLSEILLVLLAGKI